MNDRAVSIPVGYTLNAAVAVILISGLFIATQGLIEDRRQATARAELEVAGQQLVANLVTADRLVLAGGDTVAVSVDLPERAGGAEYQIRIENSGTRLVLLARDLGVRVEVPIPTSTPVAETTIPGGDVRIVLDGGKLEVRPA